MKKNLSLVLALVFLCLTFLAACGKGADTPSSDPTQAVDIDQEKEEEVASGQSDETLRIAIDSEPSSLLPCVATGPATDYAASLLYNNLVFYNSETGQVEPCLATSWEQKDDLTWRFFLRDDVRFHDGSAFNANEVLYTFQIGHESGLSFYTSYFDIEKCAVVDEYTIDLVLNAPLPDMLNQMCLGTYGMVSSAGVDAAGGVDAAIIKPLGGTGPYKFVSWTSGDKLVMERNEDYWGTPGYYKTIEMSFITDATTRLMALQSGDVDVITKVSISQVASAAANEKLSVTGSSTLTAYSLLFNCSGTPLEDVRVRQAIAYAIDREALFKVAALGYGEMTDINISTKNALHSAGIGYQYGHDVDKAKELLAQAGYGSGLELRLLYSTDDISATLAEQINNYLDAVGITLHIEVKDGSSSQEANKAGDYDMILNATSGYTLTRATNQLHSAVGYSTTGWAAWSNDKFDSLVDSVKSESNVTLRRDAIVEAYDIVRQEVPLIGLFNGVTFYATNGTVGGLCLNINGTCIFSNVSKLA